MPVELAVDMPLQDRHDDCSGQERDACRADGCDPGRLAVGPAAVVRGQQLPSSLPAFENVSIKNECLTGNSSLD